MQTWSGILGKSSALMNDQARAVYTNTVALPYLNIALSELQEIFELNSIPVTSASSAVINVPSGVTRIGFNTVPQLPVDLIEIQQLWESDEDQDTWSPVTKRNYLTGDLQVQDEQVTKFGVYAWEGQEIKLLSANQDNDLKIDYIKSIFIELTLGMLDQNNTILNTDTFLQYRVAGLMAEFIDENFTRAQSLNVYGASGLERSLGISVKGQQVIAIRRRPFRAAYKRRRVML